MILHYATSRTPLPFRRVAASPQKGELLETH